MSLLRYAAKRDAAERPIIQALEKAGASVIQLSAPRLPDLLVGMAGKTYLIEVKTGRAEQSRGQRMFSLSWEGSPVLVWRTTQDVIDWLEQRKSER